MELHRNILTVPDSGAVLGSCLCPRDLEPQTSKDLTKAVFPTAPAYVKGGNAEANVLQYQLHQ